MGKSDFDVVIIGGGISGAALLFLLSRYTDLPKIALLEKCSTIAALNSHGRNNSQTLHCGDIETNYTLEKAKLVRAAADMVLNYAIHFPYATPFLYQFPKMVLGVGAAEGEALRERYEQFKPHYLNMQWLDHAGIAAIEPNVAKQRQEPITALAVTNEFSAVNFQALADSFVARAQQSATQEIALHLNTAVQQIHPLESGGYAVETASARLTARFVVVCAGAHSLLFAQRLGFGKEYACLPVAGSFYYTPKLLNGKVYTVQNEKLPFAAIHGDPDILVEDKSRFGPTALILPMLERYNYATIPDFFRTFSLDRGVLKTLGDLVKEREVRNYMFKNILFEIPGVRRRLFLHDARKIIPSLQLNDLTFASRIGGIRPVMVDKRSAKLHLGEAKINPGNGIIFNMTPSPGATSCLQNGERDMRTIADYLNCQVKEELLADELKSQS